MIQKKVRCELRTAFNGIKAGRFGTAGAILSECLKEDDKNERLKYIAAIALIKAGNTPLAYRYLSQISDPKADMVKRRIENSGVLRFDPFSSGFTEALIGKSIYFSLQMRLRAVLKRFEMKQCNLAKEIDLPPSTLSSILHGKFKISKDVESEICKILKRYGATEAEIAELKEIIELTRTAGRVA